LYWVSNCSLCPSEPVIQPHFLSPAFCFIESVSADHHKTVKLAFLPVTWKIAFPATVISISENVMYLGKVEEFLK
jgi:hypothetical protein